MSEMVLDVFISLENNGIVPLGFLAFLKQVKFNISFGQCEMER